MKKIMIALVASIGLLIAGGSVAPVAPVTGGVYYGVAGTYSTQIAEGVDFADFDKHALGVVGIVGYEFTPALSAEARLGFAPYANSDEADEGIVTLDAVAVPTLYAFSGGKVYGIGGVATKYDLKAEEAKIGAVVGAGVEYSDVFVDATLKNFYDDASGTTGTVAVGFRF